MAEADVGLDCHNNSCLSSGHLIRRSVRSKCTPPRKPGINSRNLHPHAAPHNGTLWRRVMNPPPAGDPTAIGNWVYAATGNDAPSDFIVFPDASDPDPDAEMNNALYRGFNKNKEISVVGRELQGCTVLAIVSRKGVYVGHYWENIAFAPDQEQLEVKDKEGVLIWTETPDQIFQRTVIEGLRKGIKIQQDSLTKYAPALTDDHVQAYLIRPRISQPRAEQIENDPGSAIPLPDGYEQQWQLMRNEVVSQIPKIGEPGRWTEVIYDAIDHKPTLETTGKGRMLLMYDPVSTAITSRRQKPQRLVKIWSETKEIHSDTWED
jgi:hypothetical protein